MRSTFNILFYINKQKIKKNGKCPIMGRISYDITDVNLTVIITMAFRLETSEAKTLRIWFINQFTKMKSLDIILTDIGENFRLN